MFLGGTPPISEAELIKKRDILDALEDDDDIDWKHNPFDVDFIRVYAFSETFPSYCTFPRNVK